jgi:hypothetical protein
MTHHSTCPNCGENIRSDGECADDRCPGPAGTPCAFCDDPILERQYDSGEFWDPAVDDAETVVCHNACAPAGWVS